MRKDRRQTLYLVLANAVFLGLMMLLSNYYSKVLPSANSVGFAVTPETARQTLIDILSYFALLIIAYTVFKYMALRIADIILGNKPQKPNRLPEFLGLNIALAIIITIALILITFIVGMAFKKESLFAVRYVVWAITGLLVFLFYYVSHSAFKTGKDVLGSIASVFRSVSSRTRDYLTPTVFAVVGGILVYIVFSLLDMLFQKAIATIGTTSYMVIMTIIGLALMSSLISFNQVFFLARTRDAFK